MDKSSRNIVKFIATITVVALLVMAARYYAMSGEVKAPPVVEEAALPKPAPAETDPVGTEPEETDEPEVIEEDVEIKMGEPSVNIGQEAPVPTYPEAAPTQPVEPEVVEEPGN